MHTLMWGSGIGALICGFMTVLFIRMSDQEVGDDFGAAFPVLFFGALTGILGALWVVTVLIKAASS